MGTNAGKTRNAVDAQSNGQKVWSVVKRIFDWLYWFRSVVLSIPVGVAAVILAIRNLAILPSEIGIAMQATGEYAYTINRGTAVFAPLTITAVCVLMTFLSRRVSYPWLISVFSLSLPIVIAMTASFL